MALSALSGRARRGNRQAVSLVLVPGERWTRDLLAVTRAGATATQHVLASGADGLVVEVVAANTIRDNHWRVAAGSPLPVRCFLTEAAASNDLTFSEDISNAAWTKNASTAGTVTDATIYGVSGTVFTIREDGTTAAHSVSRTVSAQADSTGQPVSVYLRARGREWAYVQLTSKANTVRRAWFNLRTGAVGTVDVGGTARIVKMANGWYRCTLIASSDTGVTTPAVAIGAASADNTFSYAGTNTLDAVDVMGAQLVTDGVIETSYIPRTGSGAATRAADVVTVALDQSWIRGVEPLTIGATWVASETAAGYNVVHLGNADGTTNPRLLIAADATTRRAGVIYHNGTTVVGTAVGSGTIAIGDIVTARATVLLNGVARVEHSINTQFVAMADSSVPAGGLSLAAWSTPQVVVSGITGTSNPLGGGAGSTGPQTLLGVYIGRGEDAVSNIAQRIALARSAAR